MRQLLKRVINQTLQPLGFEFQKVATLRDPFSVQSHLLRKECPVIFDVGANVGDVSAIYKSLFPSCTIHAFEPFPETFLKLQQRFKEEASVTLNQVAVSEQDGFIALNANSSSATNSILQTDPAGAQFWGEGVLDTSSTLQVKTVSIDSYCASHKVTNIDILKLDIQGAELQALRGAKSMLETSRVGMIYLELILAPTYISQPLFEDYLRFFREAGYVMLDLFNPTRKDLRLIQSDIIFVRDRK